MRHAAIDFTGIGTVISLAEDPSSATQLRRSSRTFTSEAAVREYLVMDGDLPQLVRDNVHGVEPSEERLASGVAWAGHAVGVLAVSTLAVGLGTVGHRACIAAADVQQVAQGFACLILGEVVLAGTASVLAGILRRRWSRSTLLGALVIVAGVALSHADLGATLPFG